MKIALVGAGAVGAYYIYKFAGLDEEVLRSREFTVIAEGERKERLIRDGVTINDKVYHPTVKTGKEAGIQDIIIVATKSTGIKEAAKMLPDMVGEDTLVMSMLNGADSEEIIAEVIGKEHVLHSVIVISSRRHDGGVTFDPEYGATVTYGAYNLTDAEAKLNRVKEAFDNTGIKMVRSDNIMYDIWFKYARNICNNLPQAVVKAPSGMYKRSEHGLFIASKMWDEVWQIAALKGVTLPKEVQFYPDGDYSRYSTLQDIDSKRHTEADSLCGYVLDIAKKEGLELPYIEYTYHAIKVLEEQNDGLFER